jgi:hypothetical protein
MLTKKQKEIYKSFIATIIDKDIRLLTSEQRSWGKSYILNELGLTLQALGYKVYLLTMHHNSQEHFADDLFPDDTWDYRGKLRDKMVILVDEYKISKIQLILEFCTEYKIPIVGFVDYSQ